MNPPGVTREKTSHAGFVEICEFSRVFEKTLDSVRGQA
jgi:hypothetical protein